MKIADFGLCKEGKDFHPSFMVSFSTYLSVDVLGHIDCTSPEHLSDISVFLRYGFWGPDQYVLWDSRVSGSRGSNRHVVHAGRGLVGTRSAYIRDAGGRGERFELLRCLKRSYSVGICLI